MKNFANFNRSKKYAEGVYALKNKYNLGNEIILLAPEGANCNVAVVKIAGEVKITVAVEHGILMNDFAKRMQEVLDNL